MNAIPMKNQELHHVNRQVKPMEQTADWGHSMFSSFDQSDCKGYTQLNNDYMCLQNGINNRNMNIISTHQRCFRDTPLESKMWTDTYKDDIVLPEECERHRQKLAKLAKEGNHNTGFEMGDKMEGGGTIFRNLRFKEQYRTDPADLHKKACGQCNSGRGSGVGYFSG